MAIELPYFRFEVQSWQNGRIAIESYELQGLFVSICGYYWINDCSITLALLKKKFSGVPNLIDELVQLRLLKHEKKHDKIEIEFLDIQFDLLSEKRKRRQDAGSKGGNAKAMLKQKGSYKIRKDNSIVDKKRKEETGDFILPFESEEFKKKWEALLAQKKWKTKSPEALQGNLEFLKAHSEPDALKIIQKTINGGWQGLFELKDNEKTKPVGTGTPSKTSADDKL